MTVRIDPDGVLAMSAATAATAGTASRLGTDLQRILERVDDLLPGAPAVREPVQRAAGDLAAAAGLAREHAIRYVDDTKPLSDLLTRGYWLPDLGNLGWRGDQSVLGNIERISRSDEFGAAVLGTGASLLERYRNWRLHVPRSGKGATKALGQIADLVDAVDDVEVRGATQVVRGQRYAVRPSGLLVPEEVERARLIREGMRETTPKLLALSDDAVHPLGRQLVPDPTIGRPPTWARTAGKGLGYVGIALTLYDSGANQWEHDQKYHPEYSTGERVASTGWNVATEGGGAVAGGIVGAEIGASLGATVGSVVPVLGTGVGAVVGGVVGGAIGAFVGSKAGKAVGRGIREGAEAIWHGLFG